MSNEINDGGPAFPVSLPGWGDNGASGMTLRDYFAAKALPAITAGGTTGWAGKSDATTLAERAYAIADAMLAERAK